MNGEVIVTWPRSARQKPRLERNFLMQEKI
jgi:hypothetical protein